MLSVLRTLVSTLSETEYLPISIAIERCFTVVPVTFIFAPLIASLGIAVNLIAKVKGSTCSMAAHRWLGPETNSLSIKFGNR